MSSESFSETPPLRRKRRRLPHRMRHLIFWLLIMMASASVVLIVKSGPQYFLLGAVVSLLMIVDLYLNDRDSEWSITPRRLGNLAYFLYYSLILLNIAATAYGLLKLKYPGPTP